MLRRSSKFSTKPRGVALIRTCVRALQSDSLTTSIRRGGQAALRQLERMIRRLRLKNANLIYERKCALGMHL